MKSDEQAAIVDAMFDTEEVDSPFGKRYGSEKLVLTSEHLEALQQGKLLVVDVLGEYVVFVELEVGSGARMSGWRKMTLRRAGVSLIDCDHRTPPATESGYPYIAIPQLKQGRLDLGAVRKISPEHYIDWTRKAKPQPYDVVLSRRCNPGETAYVPPGLTCALGQNLVLLRADGAKIYPPFLRWLVRGPHWWDQIGKYINVGAVFDSLKCADIPNFEVPVPSLADQRAIARILGDLDDKIELNRQINQTLEQIAQSIFKSWFVDFEPVKAKIVAKTEVRDPDRAAMCAISGKTDVELDQLPPEQRQQLAATAALFPDELVKSELGVIPKGWKHLSLADSVHLIGGGTPKRSNAEFWGGDIPWFSVQDAPADGDAFIIDTEEKITKLGLGKSSSKLLPVGTTIISARGTVGRLALTGVEMAMNQSCYGVRGIDGVGPYFNYFNLKESVTTLQQNTHGAVFDTITRQTFETVSCVKPTKPLLDAFEVTVAPLMATMRSNLFERMSLANLRDTLLPKLLSGELPVTTADEMLQTATA